MSKGMGIIKDLCPWVNRNLTYINHTINDTEAAYEISNHPTIAEFLLMKKLNGPADKQRNNLMDPRLISRVEGHKKFIKKMYRYM